VLSNLNNNNNNNNISEINRNRLERINPFVKYLSRYYRIINNSSPDILYNGLNFGVRLNSSFILKLYLSRCGGSLSMNFF